MLERGAGWRGGRASDVAGDFEGGASSGGAAEDCWYAKGVLSELEPGHRLPMTAKRSLSLCLSAKAFEKCFRVARW